MRADGLAARVTPGLRSLFCCFVPWKGDRSGTARGPHCPVLLLQPPLPHTHSSLSLWSGGVRGNGQERAGIELCPGHSWAAAQARQPVSASCCCCNAWAVLIPPVLGLQSQGDPSHREIPVTGKSRSQGNPGLREMWVIGKSQSLAPGLHFPACGNILSGSDRAFSAQTEKYHWGQGRAATCCY